VRRAPGHRLSRLARSHRILPRHPPIGGSAIGASAGIMERLNPEGLDDPVLRLISRNREVFSTVPSATHNSLPWGIGREQEPAVAQGLEVAGVGTVDLSVGAAGMDIGQKPRVGRAVGDVEFPAGGVLGEFSASRHQRHCPIFRSSSGLRNRCFALEQRPDRQRKFQGRERLW
jgi:hypothetical protein